MKLKTIKEIESLSANHANFYTTPENHDWHGRYSSYKNSYIKAQQDLLSQASEGFEEWIYQAPDKCDLREFEKSHHNFFVAQEAWQAATLANEKKYQERINDARKDILYLIEVLITYPVLIESKDNMGSLHQNIKEFIEKWELNK